MMKKIVVLIALLSIVLFVGCVGTTALGVYDDSVPEASLCPLELRNNLSVIIYDDQPVTWEPTLTANKTTIALPPGGHTFIFRYYVQRSYGGMTEYVAQTATVSQEFLAGHSYRIYQQNIWLVFFTISSIKCKDVTPKSKA
jgi:hypothetical protein